jgi:two-component system sensor histidine kinase MtrB
VAVDPELQVLADPNGFERIMANLIVNALRHGRPPVDVRDEADARVRLVVQDHGDGVPEPLVSRLFERFSRGEGRGGGAGLGLAIARSFALALGGDLTYEHAEPHGARFTLLLPAAL